MNIELRYVKVRDLVKNYINDDEEGVYGLDGKLNIRPPYQREFVYKEAQRNAVINTVSNKLPLSIFYWSKCNDGMFEVLDGQQRTISICSYVNGDFSVNYRYFHNLSKEEQNEFLDYELLVYVCDGTEAEKLAWFKVINIATVVLTEQEIRNAVYHGPFVTNARKYFSKTQCPAYKIADKLMSGSCIRQDYLEAALRWIAHKEGTTIDEYMAKHQHDVNAAPLWSYFSKVVAWVGATFQTYRREMKGLEWGVLYNQYFDKDYDTVELESEVKRLMEDDDVTSKKGIYEYLLSGKTKERLLSIRTFDEKQKRAAYERQNGICLKCGQHFEFEEMQGDHIVPWVKGGKTVVENLQMLCRNCNNDKSDN